MHREIDCIRSFIRHIHDGVNRSCRRCKPLPTSSASSFHIAHSWFSMLNYWCWSLYVYSHPYHRPIRRVVEKPRGKIIHFRYRLMIKKQCKFLLIAAMPCGHFESKHASKTGSMWIGNLRSIRGHIERFYSILNYVNKSLQENGAIILIKRHSKKCNEIKLWHKSITLNMIINWGNTHKAK